MNKFKNGTVFNATAFGHVAEITQNVVNTNDEMRNCDRIRKLKGKGKIVASYNISVVSSWKIKY